MEVLTRQPDFGDDVRRLTLNAEITKPLNPGYTTDILAFEGVVGQRLLFDGILPDGANFASANIDVRLVSPSGQVVFDLKQAQYPYTTAAARDVGPFTLTESGTYNLLLVGYQVRLNVSDGKGGTSTQNFQLKVHAEPGNATPTIVSDPGTKTFTNRTYTYDVDAIDADGDTLTYSLATAPQGMFIDNETGDLTWRTPIVGTHAVKVRVVDAKGGIDYQSFDVVVSSEANGKVTGTVYNDLDADGLYRFTNPNNLTPYTGLTFGDHFTDTYTAYDLGLPKGLPAMTSATN